MKFNYKKIASVFASAVMLSSTIGFAAAATYPSPFTDGAGVVYGTAGASSDMSAAIDIYDQLKDRVSGSTGLDASVSGEAKPVETSSQPLYLGDDMNTTKETFTVDQLSSVLAGGKVTDDDGKELDYELKINIPDTKIKYGETADTLDAPVIYADFDGTTLDYGLRIIFPTAVNTTKLTDESITLFGKDYVFSGSVSDLSDSKVVLFEKATSIIVNDGEEVVAEGHTISVAVEDTNTASITIDGVAESKDEGWSGKIGGVDIYVKNVMGPSVAGVSRFVEIYLNSNKLTLEHTSEVTLGSDSVDSTNVTFVNSSSKVSEIRIDVTPYNLDDAVKYIKQGDSLTDPVFGSIKLELASVTPEIEADARDYILVKPSGESKASLQFTNKAGKEYDMNLLGVSPVSLNASYVVNSTGAAQAQTYNATDLGVDTKDLIVTTAGIANATDFFITCSNEYTQIWEVKSIKATSSTREVKVRDQGSGSSDVTVSMNSAVSGGSGTLTLGDGSSATIMYTYGTTGVNVSSACDYLYTKNGARIWLGGANAPTNNASKITIEEETSYNGGAFTDNAASAVGKNVTVRLGFTTAGRTGKDMHIRDVLGTEAGTLDTDYFSDDVGDYDYYYLTKYGTYVKRTGDTDKQVAIWYPEDAMSIGFYLGETSSTITPGTTGTAGGGQIEILKDMEVTSTYAKNLIVVGGSCVNTVAA